MNHFHTETELNVTITVADPETREHINTALSASKFTVSSYVLRALLKAVAGDVPESSRRVRAWIDSMDFNAKRLKR